MKENPFFKRSSVLVVSVFTLLFLGFLDYVTGYELGFFVFYFVPIAIAAWKVGLTSSYLISILSSIVWFFGEIHSFHPYSSVFFLFWNTVIRLFSFLIIAYSTSKIRFLLEKERETSQALRDAVSHIKTLSGLIPICASCKKIRDDKGYWQRVEEYIEAHTNAQFTHGLCQECVDKLLKEGGIDNSPQLPPGGRTG